MVMKVEIETKERLKKILLVAFPLIIQGLVFQLQSLTDKAFLGNLDTRYVSAAGAAQMPYMAIMDSIVAISTGLVIIVSKLFGAGKKDEIVTYVRSMAFYNTLIGILMFGLWYFGAESILKFFLVDPQIIAYSVTYVKICAVFFLFVGMDSSLQAMMQGVGETKPIMYSSIIKVGFNIVLSWILIFGKMGFQPLGVMGAAIGTLVANIVSFLFLFVYCVIYKRKTYKLWTINREFLFLKTYFEIVKLGVPVGLEFLLWNVANLLLIRFINGFSYLDMAIYTLTFGFQCIVFVILMGTSKATLSMIGQKIGAGKHKEANQFFYTTIAINFIIVLIAAGSFICFPKALLGIFTDDIAVIKRGGSFLILIGVILFPQSVNVICGNAIRAHGNTKWMLFSQILGSILVVSVSWFMVGQLHMNMVAIYITLFLDETFRGTINFIYYHKKYDKKS